MSEDAELVERCAKVAFGTNEHGVPWDECREHYRRQFQEEVIAVLRASGYAELVAALQDIGMNAGGEASRRALAALAAAGHTRGSSSLTDRV